MRFKRSAEGTHRRRAISSGAWFTSVVLLITGPCAGQALQWKLAAEDRFQVEFVQMSETRTDVANRTPGAVPRKTTTSVETMLTMDWEVSELDADQNAVIDQSISRIRLSVTNPALPSSSLEFDTSSEERISAASSAMLDQVRPLVGLKFRVTMSPKGKIVAITLPEQTQSTLRKLPGSPQLQSLFTEQGISELFGATAIVLPSEDVDVDSAWEDDSTVSTAFGKFKRTRKYRYTGNEQVDGRNLAVFKIETTLNELTAAPGDTPPKLVHYSESGSASFDIDAGFFRRCRVQGLTQTELNYREKKIQTTVENSVEMTITQR